MLKMKKLISVRCLLNVYLSNIKYEVIEIRLLNLGASNSGISIINKRPESEQRQKTKYIQTIPFNKLHFLFFF